MLRARLASACLDVDALSAAAPPHDGAERATTAARKALTDAEDQRESARGDEARLARELEAAKAEIATLRARR
jgi:hypothetical protein